jgi:fused signal recognition particle receptor
MVEIIDKWKTNLARSSKIAFGRIASIIGATEINAETWDELETILIQADLGIDTTQSIISSLKKTTLVGGITKTENLFPMIINELLERLQIPPLIRFNDHPAVILVVGVNGSGKTTSVAKLGYTFTNNGKRVLLVAADTYRPAAIDQLQVWAEKLGLSIIAGQEGSDPGAVVYDSIKSAIARNMDMVLVDTAGRLHTRYNLMEELKKIARVTEKAFPGAPHAVWLVLDATTGQNALVQARAFKEAVNVTGIILAKLDTSAKGGMIFAIQKELGIPILFAGLGEKVSDLEVFNPESFVNAIIPNLI